MPPRVSGRHSPRVLATASVLCAFFAGALGAAWAAASDAPVQAVAGFAGTIAREPAPADPFPIRRIRVVESQLPDVLKQLDAGPLVRLSRPEFESRVRAAGSTATEARILPRVTDERFRATLVGGDLIGTAEFDIANPAPAPRLLALEPLRLALGKATWNDGREAAIAVPNGATSAAVWVDRPGRQTLKFEWSLAGAAELGEQRFELRVPTAPTASLTLELPMGVSPVAAAADALVTGPFPGAAEPARAEWRFRFGGRPRLDFAVRPAVNPGATAAAALAARYVLAPGQLSGAFEYDLRPSRGTVGEWSFHVDPGLRVTDVVVNNRAGWVIDPPAADGEARLLRVSLHQPGAGGKVLISTVAPYPDATRPPDAPLPGVRPVGANLDDEAIEIRLAPGLKPEYWRPGDYRLIDSQVLADQSRSLTLTGTLLPAESGQTFRRLPTLRTAPTEVEFTTAEQIAWRFDADHAAVLARMELHVRRGSLFEFALRAPVGYRFVRATAAQEDLLNHVSTAADTTTVEFAQPLGAGQAAELTFEFRGPSLAATRTFPFPAFVPRGAAERAGVLAILPGSLWDIEPRPGVGSQPAGWFDLAEPHIPSGAAAAYRYRSISPDGTVNVWSRLADFSARTTTSVVHLPGMLIGTTTIDVRIRSGGLAALVVVENGGGTAQRSWRVVAGGNAVTSAVELPVQALANQLVRPAGWPGRVVIGGTDPPPGRVWLVRFARPVTGDITLESSATRQLASGATDAAIAAARDAFARWVVPGAASEASTPAPGPPVDTSKLVSNDRRYSDLYLVTAVRSPADVVVIFGGSVVSPAETSLGVQLPSGAELRAACIAGRWLEPGACRLSEKGEARLPFPQGGPVRFEVRYRLPANIQLSAGLVRSPDPVLPDLRRSALSDGGEIRRWWVFAADILPGWPARSWTRVGPDELPKLLGDSPVNWTEDPIVSRTTLDEVRVGTGKLADTIGLTVAIGLVLLLWSAVRRGHPFPALVGVAALVVLGAVSLLGPSWWQRLAASPLVVGLIGAAAMVVVRGRRSVASWAVVMIALVRYDSHAQPSAPPAEVVIIESDPEGREVVLAPKSVLDRLSPTPTAPGVLLSSSRYAVRVDDAAAQITATYVVHALADGETLATLPLADARLEKVLVNGSAAYPTAPRPGVYTVPLPGKGRQMVEVVFSVPLGGAGGERELRFGVPECPTTHVSADLPGGARQAQAIGRIGRGGAVTGERVKLEVDVGAAKAVHLRWREGMGGSGAATAIKIREGCVWDITEAGAELTACYLARIEQGTLGAIQFSVPAELDTLAVVARSLDAAGTATLRDWTIGKEQNGFRPLRVEFQAPISGQVLVVLTCAPRSVISRQPLLRFPKPVIPGSSAEPDAAYGLRVRGVAVDDPGRFGVIDYAPDALLRDFGAVIGRQDADAPIRVFRPTPGGNPHLRPTLRVAVDLPAATMDTTWTIGPNRADAAGTIHWTGKDAPGAREFSLPGVTLLEVRGADVASWGRDGARVQVWFQRSVREAAIEWTGTIAAPGNPLAAATPQPADVRLASNTVRLRAAQGYTLRIERDRGWSAVDAPGETLALRTSTADAPPVRVLVGPAPPTLPPARPHAAVPPTNPESSAARASLPPAPAPTSSVEAPRWAWPFSAMAGWLAAALALAVLIARLPQATWPEQFGLVCGMFALAFAGSWWLGVAGWATARLAWVADRVRHRRAES